MYVMYMYYMYVMYMYYMYNCTCIMMNPKTMLAVFI